MKAYAIPGTDTNSIVEVEVKTADGEYKTHKPRPPIDGDTQRVVNVRPDETVEEVYIVSRQKVEVSSLVEVPYVG